MQDILKDGNLANNNILKKSNFKEFTNENKHTEEGKSSIKIEKSSNNYLVPKKYKEAKRNTTYNNINSCEKLGGILVFDIIDTGIGMKESDLEKIFQPFFQANTTVKHQGTGLGLWITHQLVSAMNGVITVQSEYKHGTTFRITIPLKTNYHFPIGSLQAHQDNSINHHERYPLFSNFDSPFAQKSKITKISYILITYKTQKEKIIIDELFFNENSNYQFNKDSKVYDYEKGLLLIKESKEQINSIILFSRTQFVSSLYFVNQLREFELSKKLYPLPILMIGSEEVKTHAIDFKQMGISNFVYDIFSIINIAKKYKKMIKKEQISQKFIRDIDLNFRNSASGDLDKKLIKIQAKVLIIDDDIFSADTLKRMIEKVGSYSVRLAGNGSKGFEIYETSYSELSLIITDIHLPDIDGITLCKNIREYEESNNLSKKPIIGLTGSDSKEIIDSALKAGMNELFVKPLEKIRLIALLEKYINK